MSTKGGKRYYFGRVAKRAKPGEAQETLDFVMKSEGLLIDDCIIWPHCRGSMGYAMLRGRLVSTIICEQKFGPRPSPDHFAAHECGEGMRGCFHPGHVSGWKTKHENEADKVRHGTKAAGDRHGARKVDSTIVAAMREMLASGLPRSFIAISMRGVLSRRGVDAILSGRTWRLTAAETAS